MAQQLLEIELTHGFDMSPGFVTLSINGGMADDKEKIQVKFQRFQDIEMLAQTDKKNISDKFRIALAQAILFGLKTDPINLKTESRCVVRGEIYISKDNSTVDVSRLRRAAESISFSSFKDTFKDILSGMNSPDVQTLADDFCEKVGEEFSTVDHALNHPVFWSAAQKISFFKNTHAKTKENPSPPKSMKGKNWINELFIPKDQVQDFINELNNMNRGGSLSIEETTIRNLATEGRFRTYEAKSWRDFLAFFRNIHAHFWQQDENVQLVFHDENDGYWEFFSKRFPGLLLEVYKQFNDLANSSNAREPKFLPDIYESKNRQQTVSRPKPDLGKYDDKRKMQKRRPRTDR